MRTPTAITAALLFFASWITVVATPDAGAAPCTPTMSFAVGGVGDPGSVNVPYVPPGPRTNIAYPASIAPIGGNTSGDESVRQGTANLTSAVNAYRNACPSTAISMVGYSLGAIPVSDACATTPNVTCITAGNPKAANGVSANLPTFIPGFTFTGARRPPAPGSVVIEHCNPRDIYCNSGNPFTDPAHFVDAAIGTYLEGQHAY